jgi:hypothetical protein
VAYARVVSFEGVEQSRMDELKQQIEQDERPEGIPATEIVVLYDREGGKSLAIVFFDSEEDYRTGDETLNAMDPSGTPGRRTSVDKYEVLVKRSA